MQLKLGPIQIIIVRPPGAKATLGELQAARASFNPLGTGAEWAPENYGNYFAFSVPTYRAVKLRADAVSSARLMIFRRGKDKSSEPVPDDHPLQSLLDHVNPWWTGADLWKATETYLSLWGSSYWFLERQGSQIKNIWPLRPDRMRIIVDRREIPNQYITGFLYQANRTIRFNPEEIVWFRYFNPLDEYAGLSPVAPGRLSLDMGHAALRFNREFFRNGAVPQDLIFPVQGPITEDEVEDFYRRLAKRHSGADKAHRPMIWDLSQGGKPERLGLSQRDMEFLETLNYTVEDAARIWGVPPPKLYSQKQSIYNNVKQADIDFYADTIANEWKFLETEVNELLLPHFGDKELFCAFDLSNILPLQEALADQKKIDLEEVKTGTLTINEYRAKHKREAVDWGDVWWKPFALTATADETAEGGGPQQALPGRSMRAIETLETKALTSFDKLLSRAEAEFRGLQKNLFRNQRADILKKLREARAIRQVDDSLFDQAAWNEKYMAKGARVFRTILVLSALEHARDFALGAFDPDNPAVREWLAERVMFWAERVNLETAQLLMAELAESRALGESIPQIQQRIEKVFNFNDAVRSERIARTETLATANKGHLAVYDQSGVVEEKMWLATLDERVREAHAEAHRQVVPKDGRFYVGGEYLDAPGLGGNPGNVINCRCVVAPVITRRAIVSLQS